MKQRCQLILFAVILMIGVLSEVSLAQDYRVEVSGQEVVDANPVVREGQLLAWSRPLAAAVGTALRWYESDRRIDLQRDGHQVAYWLGSRTVFRDGSRYQAPAAAVNVGGRSYVPVWFTATLFGDEVSWDGHIMRVQTRRKSRESSLEGRWFYFPFPQGVNYNRHFTNNYGDGRSWGPDGASDRIHTGIDILAPKGTPVVAAGSGTVIRYGWNAYGGWRLTIELNEPTGWRFYYAHLNGYGPNLYEGARVEAGQLIGYVGNTGYGPVGTQGQFDPHLHFAIYKPDWSTINPYGYLKSWESNKVRLP